MAPWGYNPHSGGIKIPERLKEPMTQRILAYAKAHYAGKYNRIETRFKDKFCYIDAYIEPYVSEKNFNEERYGCTREERIEFLRKVPTHLCRLRYIGDTEKWTMAFYTYSNEKYESSMFRNGTSFGTPEEAFETSSVYLR